MEDDNNTPLPEDDESKKSSRMDDLLNAKEEAEKEAQEWRAIEQEGNVVSSADPPEIDEPPRKPGDTPTGSSTPPEGMPKIDPDRLAEMLGSVGDQELEESQSAPDKESAPSPEKPHRPPPRFLHPTDAPPVQPEAPEEEEIVPSSSSSSTPERRKTDDDIPFKINPSDADWSSSTGDWSVSLEDDDNETSPPEYTPTERANDTPIKRQDDAPLPRRVPREDPEATITTPSAFRDPPPSEKTIPSGIERPDFTQPTRRPDFSQQQQPPPGQRSRAPEPPPPAQQSRAAYPPPAAEVISPPQTANPRGSTSQGVAIPQPQRKKRRKRITMGCIARTAALGLLGGFVAFLLAGGAAAIYYSQVTAPAFRDINDITDLQERALQFETTRIRDSEGNVLYQINDPNGGLRDYVDLEDISPWVIYGTVATEERDFFTNPGFSIPAIIRAVVQNIQEGAVVSGASTITQQLARALLLDEEERTQRTVERKIREVFLAAELGRRFSKEEILELYLNQVNYGNLAYGIESASQLYFDKPASELNSAEAAFLVGIPQAPSVWDPVSDPDAAYFRMREQVFVLMLETGNQGGVNTGRTGIVLPIFDDQEFIAANRYIEESFPEQFERPNFEATYPHWVFYVSQLLENDPAIGPEGLYRSGYDVYTTIDPRIQNAAEAQVRTTLAGLTDRNVNNASVIVIDSDTGAILAMVGSADFYDETIDGQVNIALTPQQPGSSIKPFTYLTSFREGWSPGTVIWDVPIEYEIPGFGVYEPTNYGNSGFSGPVSVRHALANSMNVPAVLTVDYVGVDSLLETLNDLGVTSLGTSANENGYGLSLTLGAGEVRLLEWTNAYAVLSNGGTYRPTYAIERIEIDGEVIQQYEVPAGEQVLDPNNLYLLQSILTDYDARVPSFGSNSPLSPPGYVAGAKTGTTNDFRDNWTMGFTTEIAVGVWVGNTDNSPMFNVTGVTGAGPIWRGVMDTAQQWYPSGQFVQPPGVQRYTICRDDGAEPSEFCEEIARTGQELYKVSNPPLPPNEGGLYRELRIDTFTGLIANDFCDEFTSEELFLVIPNPSQLIDVPTFAFDWLLNNERGRNWASGRNIDFNEFSSEAPPEESCDNNTPRPDIEITSPQAGSVQEGVILIRGTVDAPNFQYYTVDFGLSHDPKAWANVQGRTDVVVRNGVLGQFDLSPFVTDSDTNATIRVIVVDQNGNRAERRVTFQIAQATPTPTPTQTPTPDPEEENTPTPTPDGG